MGTYGHAGRYQPMQATLPLCRLISQQKHEYQYSRQKLKPDEKHEAATRSASGPPSSEHFPTVFVFF